MEVALLGATGQIGRSLSYIYSQSDDNVHPFSRIDALPDRHFDLIINSTGNQFQGNAIFDLIEKYDRIIFDYLNTHRDCKVVSFSSGVAGNIRGNYTDRDYYAIAKLNSEAKHRASPYNIVDIRIYSFFSRFCKLDQLFFISQVVSSIISGKELVVTADNVERDYISMRDLFNLIQKCSARDMNDCFDAFSAEPVNKMELLHELHKTFGLKYSISDRHIEPSVSGFKSSYLPEWTQRTTDETGYRPTTTSMDNIITEIQSILKGHNDSIGLSNT